MMTFSHQREQEHRRGKDAGMMYRSASQFRVRTSAKPSANGRTLTGLCVPYLANSEPMRDSQGTFVEQYGAGCFGQSIRSGDVRALVEHDMSKLLARQGTGRLRFREERDGLFAEIDMPAASYADDVLALVKTGDLDSMSCGFFILAEKWSSQDGQRTRIITQGRLIEVSSVAMPAYSQTSLALAEDEDEQLMHDPEDDDLDFDDLDVLATASSGRRLTTRSSRKGSVPTLAQNEARLAALRAGLTDLERARRELAAIDPLAEYRRQIAALR